MPEARKGTAEYAEQNVEPKCPECQSTAYVCNETHYGLAAPVLHCKGTSLHNFVKGLNGEWSRVD